MVYVIIFLGNNLNNYSLSHITYYFGRVHMKTDAVPVLTGKSLFRDNELVYVNRSDELKEFNGIMHKHDFIEIAYVISGKGLHIVGDRKYNTSKGDLFIVNYDMPHGFFPDPADGTEPVVYNCVFMPNFLDASLIGSMYFQDIFSSFLFKSFFPEESPKNADLSLKGTEYQDIGNLFRKMYEEYKNRNKGYIEIIRAYLIELIVKILRLMDKNRQSNISQQNQRLVYQAVEYLRNNYKTDIRLDELAAKSFISKNYFSRLFKEVTGISFTDYVQNLRIDEACNLLKNTDMKVTDIAHQVGFKDMKFFYEVFKKLTGKTPGEFRKS
ncbi:AraC family transcriptional regulator [Thermoclostridium stercorarium subsp. thermolacticum DSM 2910]|nr:DNA-binding domain-containing protein [Thermoclostridium stercorarium subsp. stercorarium DSM 8532]ANW98083.1 AraC family transcriptional regulator [Thermoclostridium stercorarium subsp. thermolacticum DSM 2910]